MVSNGTWVRFPGPLPFSILFFLLCFHVAFPPESYHAPSAEACHASQEIHLMVRSLSPPCILSQPCAYKSEKSTWPSFKWAQFLLILPPDWGQHPPLVCISFSFSLFFYLFVLFILFNSSKLIFIKYKKKSESHKIKIYFI